MEKKVAVVGAGAVGCYFGGKLAHGHFDVTFIARGENYEALKTNGIQIFSARGDLKLPQVNALREDEVKEKADIIFLTTKTWDLDGAIRATQKLVHDDSKIYSLQCGITKDEKLIKEFGKNRVAGGLSDTEVFQESPGVIRHIGANQKLTIGDFDGRISEATTWLEIACRTSRIDIEVDSAIAERLWENLIYNASVSGVTSFLKLPLGSIRRNPENRDMLTAALKEGCDISKVAGYPIHMHCADYLMEAIDKLPSFSTSAMYKNLQNGKPLELEHLSGEIIELGKKHNIPTPVHQKIYDALIPFVNGRK